MPKCQTDRLKNLFGLFLILGTLLGNAIDNTFGKTVGNTVGNPVVNTVGDERISGGKQQTSNKWYHTICKICSVWFDLCTGQLTENTCFFNRL